MLLPSKLRHQFSWPASLIALIFTMAAVGCNAQKVESIFAENCQSCHAASGDQSLFDKEWKYGASPKAITDNIRKGIVDAGMPAFGETLSDENIRSLAIYIREQQYKKADQEQNNLGLGKTMKAAGHPFKLEKVASPGGDLWSLNFLPNGDLLVTQKSGVLLRIDTKNKVHKIKNIPEVSYGNQGGLLEVAPHPDYAKNGWIYLSFSHANKAGKRFTKVARGKIKKDKWHKEETIYRADDKFYTGAGYHFGSRFAFKDGYVFFSIGDRGRQDQAQSIENPAGKIHRLHDDGRVPKDNPFVNAKSAQVSIFSFGNRNAQGLDIHPETQELWESEHGPRGGDEINIIRPGLNYGWPTITYGMNYNGTPITSLTEKEGMEQPEIYWVPSIAVSGIHFYRGQAFPKWKNQLLVASLAKQELHLLNVENNKIVADQILFEGLGNIRDVVTAPGGSIYATIAGDIIRLAPVK